MSAYRTIRVSIEEPVCRIQLDRPDSDNAINSLMIRELHEVLDAAGGCGIVVLSGLPEVFCSGADFASSDSGEYDPVPLFDLWMRLAAGPFVTVAHVRGRTNAGGVGFVAASDIVIAEPAATFALSELLFGLYPAMVLPFLTRRTGYQRAHYLTLTTKPVTAPQAAEWGLVDVCADRSQAVVAQHLGRLSKLPKPAIAEYKRYMSDEIGPLRASRDAAVTANRRMFADRSNVERITRFVEHGVLPWEKSPPSVETRG